MHPPYSLQPCVDCQTAASDTVASKLYDALSFSNEYSALEPCLPSVLSLALNLQNYIMSDTKQIG